jgi:hypothetical protein
MHDPRLHGPHGRRRVRIEGIGFGQHRSARPGEPERPEALCHEAPRSCGAASGEQVVGALRPQAIGHDRSGGAFGVPRVAEAHRPGQRRQLVHDHLGPGGRHRPGDRVGVQRVGHDGMGSQAAHEVLLRRGSGHPDHHVASRDELGDERSAEDTGGAGYEDVHGSSCRLIFPRRRDGGAARDGDRRARRRQRWSAAIRCAGVAG